MTNLLRSLPALQVLDLHYCPSYGVLPSDNTAWFSESLTSLSAKAILPIQLLCMPFLQDLATICAEEATATEVIECFRNCPNLEKVIIIAHDDHFPALQPQPELRSTLVQLLKLHTMRLTLPDIQHWPSFNVPNLTDLDVSSFQCLVDVCSHSKPPLSRLSVFSEHDETMTCASIQQSLHAVTTLAVCSMSMRSTLQLVRLCPQVRTLHFSLNFPNFSTAPEWKEFSEETPTPLSHIFINTVIDSHSALLNAKAEPVDGIVDLIMNGGNVTKVSWHQDTEALPTWFKSSVETQVASRCVTTARQIAFESLRGPY